MIFIDFPDFYNSLFLVRNHILEAQEHVNNHNRDFLIWDCFELDGARQSLVGWQPPRSGEFLPGNPHTHMGGASPPPPLIRTCAASAMSTPGEWDAWTGEVAVLEGVAQTAQNAQNA